MRSIGFITRVFLFFSLILFSISTITAQDPIEISIIYAPESEAYMPQIMANFNALACEQGLNPNNPGESLEAPICITGESGSSGTISQEIVDAFFNPSNDNLARPTIFQPSVSHWLRLANHRASSEIFVLQNTIATTRVPVVMAIWESRLQAIQDTTGKSRSEIGWSDLLDVANSPNGWNDYGIEGRSAVWYGHTDPFVSSTALSTLMSEYYASTGNDVFQGQSLTIESVNDPDIQAGVREFEELIKHYAQRTTEFRNQIAQGPEYLDFVALEEDTVIAINRGETDFIPPEPLVALYPREGLFIHEHPMGIVNAPWTTQIQRSAAIVFARYVTTEQNQTLIMQEGFRPVLDSVPLNPSVFGVSTGVNSSNTGVLDRVIEPPSEEVIATIQDNWGIVRKGADVLLVIDVSGSMIAEGRLENARVAATNFLNRISEGNYNIRLGIIFFNDEVRVAVELNDFNTNSADLYSAIELVQPYNQTELYSAVVEATNILSNQTGDRTRAIILLSDGRNEGTSGTTIDQAIEALVLSSDSQNPVQLYAIPYGSEADLEALGRMSLQTNTLPLNSVDPGEIEEIFETFSTYF